MLRIHVVNEKQDRRFDHSGGPLEFGRGPQRQCRRFVVDDAFFSRDQLQVEELADGRIRLENLSHKNPIGLGGNAFLAIEAVRELPAPLRLTLGATAITVERESFEAEAAALDTATLMTIHQPILKVTEPRILTTLSDLGDSPAPQNLAHWLETIVALQRSATGLDDLCRQTAQAMVELIGLDASLVLLRHGENWDVAASHMTNSRSSPRYSRTLLNHVVAQRQTFYQDVGAWASQTVSLKDIAAVVVSPIFGLQDEVIGVLYGSRTQHALAKVGPIRPLEAQVVQLLAAAVGAQLVRVEATRTRVQFEQFFSPELARELERDPDLLEGHDREVTILVSDLRGFSALSEKLGPQQTCRLLRDMMSRLSERIVEQGGVIVDYAGDGILAMWNAPAHQDDHALRAAHAALAMQAELPSLNQTWQEITGKPLRVGIGLSTGPAQVGNIGSSRKFKYGPNGHTVNLASRVQDATKKFGLPLLMTASTRDQLPNGFAHRRLGRTYLPGIAEAVVLYELHGESASPEWLAQRDIYEKALALYESRQWSQACQTLLQLPELAQQKEHYDAPTLKLMKRAWSCLESPPEPFDAVIE